MMPPDPFSMEISRHIWETRYRAEGGSARGWSHISVIHALADAGIEPDLICGTSIGALVGAAYVGGELGPLEDWVRSLRLQMVVGFLDFSLNGGLIKGDKLIAFFRDHFVDRDIADLKRPVGAVATDLQRGPRYGCAKAASRMRCGSRLRYPACSPRFNGMAAGWLTEGWSTRFGCRCAERWVQTL